MAFPTKRVILVIGVGFALGLALPWCLRLIDGHERSLTDNLAGNVMLCVGEAALIGAVMYALLRMTGAFGRVPYDRKVDQRIADAVTAAARDQAERIAAILREPASPSVPAPATTAAIAPPQPGEAASAPPPAPPTPRDDRLRQEAALYERCARYLGSSVVMAIAVQLMLASAVLVVVGVAIMELGSSRDDSNQSILMAFEVNPDGVKYLCLGAVGWLVAIPVMCLCFTMRVIRVLAVTRDPASPTPPAAGGGYGDAT